jgi:diguanylate cyclase (GGDEF)-like protein
MVTEMTENKLLELAEARDKAEEEWHKAFVDSRTAVYEIKKKYEAAKKASLTDELTGLGNRRAYELRLDEEASRVDRYREYLSLLLIDLDGFKAYNDRHGHDAGDELLKDVGPSIKRRIRKSDGAYRKGGDEFAVILPNTLKKGAFKVAEALRKSIGEVSEEVTASIGFATYPHERILIDDLKIQADRYLYDAKHAGGNAVYPIVTE